MSHLQTTWTLPVGHLTHIGFPLMEPQTIDLREEQQVQVQQSEKPENSSIKVKGWTPVLKL